MFLIAGYSFYILPGYPLTNCVLSYRFVFVGDSFCSVLCVCLSPALPRIPDCTRFHSCIIFHYTDLLSVLRLSDTVPFKVAEEKSAIFLGVNSLFCFVFYLDDHRIFFFKVPLSSFTRINSDSSFKFAGRSHGGSHLVPAQFSLCSLPHNGRASSV